MPFIKMYGHFVWATKSRKKLLSLDNKNILCQHIREYSKAKQIHLLNINGWHDHLHALISISSDQNIQTIMNLIKGESSYWANRNLSLPEKFGWQEEYFAVSVGESQLKRVNGYIDKQEKHHQVKPFSEEYEEFIKNYRFHSK
ncbi:MAG: IS200/IS605 family transposase [Gracilimonas sp.]|uniref:IS200/IS605 family transposase n=1 Tax=Gracilimonas TaxID=649462 RepID=UPI001B26A4A8|nr:IS200/IS605 family transposase [Gracilimonas sp.]MBO6584817.1 IS200/IS605 family transposase [Gracilimonas sp.]MBO6615912.1 IS200/IS605 family transposase [Gracilimonas sp.]